MDTSSSKSAALTCSARHELANGCRSKASSGVNGALTGITCDQTEQAALKCLYLTMRSLGPIGKGQVRWIMR